MQAEIWFTLGQFEFAWNYFCAGVREFYKWSSEIGWKWQKLGKTPQIRLETKVSVCARFWSAKL